MTLELGSALTKKVEWDTTTAKVMVDECIGIATDTSRESTQNSISSFFLFVFNSVLTSLGVPAFFIKPVGSLLTDVVVPGLNNSIDSVAKTSSDLARKSIHTSIDVSATSSQRVWNWIS